MKGMTLGEFWVKNGKCVCQWVHLQGGKGCIILAAINGVTNLHYIVDIGTVQTGFGKIRQAELFI